MQVDKGRLLQTVLARLENLEKGKSVLLQPYKKDRNVCVISQIRGSEYLNMVFVKENLSLKREKSKN